MIGSGRTGLSVVIPTRNRRELLSTTLASVLDQRDVDLEVVVVDDGSDAGVAAIPEFHDCRVRVVRHSTRRGVAAARNTGIAAATKEWLAFTDDDDIWAPEKLSSQLRALEKSAARWSCGGVVQVDDDLNVFRCDEPPPIADVSDQMLIGNAIPGGGSGVVADTDLVRRVGGFDESLSVCADYDLWIRLALSAPVAAVNRPLIAYRVHDLGMSRELGNIYAELDIIEEKYAAERSRRGLVTADALNTWIADRHQRSGHRVPAARAYMRASSTLGRPRAVARALEALVWPGSFRRRDARWAERAPLEWVSEAETWLAPVRAMQDGLRQAHPARSA